MPEKPGAGSLRLHREERWRVSIESSSYRWTVSRSNHSRFVLLSASLYRCLSFAIVCIFIWLPSPPFGMSSHDHRSIAGTNAVVTLTTTSSCFQKHTELHGYNGQLHVLCWLARHTANNHELSRQPRIFTETHQNMRRGGVQCLARD